MPDIATAPVGPAHQGRCVYDLHFHYSQLAAERLVSSYGSGNAAMKHRPKTLVVQAAHGQIDGRSRHPARLL
jgi:hypothetical protein